MDTQQPQTKIDWERFHITKIARFNGCKAASPSGVARFINKRRNAMVLARMLNRPSAHKLTPLPDESRLSMLSESARLIFISRDLRYVSHALFDSRLESAAKKDYLIRNPRKRVVHNVECTIDRHRHFIGGTTRELNGKWAKDVNWVCYHSRVDIFNSGRAIHIECTGRGKLPKRLALKRAGFVFKKPYSATGGYRLSFVELHKVDAHPKDGLIARLQADHLWDDDAQKNIDRLCADAIGGAA